MAGTLVPRYERHAIAQATFAVEWQQPLDEALFKQILDRHGLIAESLPRKQIGRGLMVSLGGYTPVVSGSPTAITTLIFDRVEPDGESNWVVMVNPNQLSVTCNGREYSRWSEISVRASDYLKFVLQTVMPVRPVTVVALQYVDEFRWEGADRDTFTADKLFQRDKKYLAPAVFESVGLWHSHHGFYINGTEPVRHRTLNNINVSVVDTDDQHRAAQIVMAHRVILDNPLTDYAEEYFSAGGLLTQLLRGLH